MNQALKIINTWCTETGLKVSPEKTKAIWFSKRNTKMDKIKKDKKIWLNNKIVEVVKEIKYLGIILDEHFNWGPQLDYALNKGKKALWATKGMVTKRWGLNAKSMQWIYKQIALPRMTHGCIVWWHAAQSKTAIKKLDTIQRLALVQISGAVRSTPTKALEALFNIIPLNLHIKALAMKCQFRLDFNKVWKSDSDQTRITSHRHITTFNDELKSKDQTDSCLTTSCEKKDYRIIINDRNNWNYTLYTINNPDCWFIDGSKKDEKVGLGIYNPKKNIKLSLRVSDNSGIAQAELGGIEKILKDNYSSQTPHLNKEIVILCDNLTTLRELKSLQSNKKSTLNCIETLNEVSKFNRVTLGWVPGHARIMGNTEADKLARKGRENIDIDLEIPLPEEEIEGKIRATTNIESLKNWNSIKTKYNHSNKLILGYDESLTKEILNLNREKIRIITGMLTGHGCLKNYLFRIGKVDNDRCGWCNLKQETMEHILFECTALESERKNLLGNNFIQIPQSNINIKKLIEFATETGLRETFKNPVNLINTSNVST